MKVAIIDYGMGNLYSVANALAAVASVDTQILVTSDPQQVRQADRVVFPGQGSMPDCMLALAQSGLEDTLREVMSSRPFLGICLGMQMLFEYSEEGDIPGLGMFEGRVAHFSSQDGVPENEVAAHFKIPHMGWNEVVYTQAAHPIWSGISSGARFYFVHSFYVDTPDIALVAGSTHYGRGFTSAVARDNIVAVQFHPEKSAADGLRLLSNFMAWQP